MFAVCVQHDLLNAWEELLRINCHKRRHVILSRSKIPFWPKLNCVTLNQKAENTGLWNCKIMRTVRQECLLTVHCGLRQSQSAGLCSLHVQCCPVPARLLQSAKNRVQNQCPCLAWISLDRDDSDASHHVKHTASHLPSQFHAGMSHSSQPPPPTNTHSP